MSHRNLPALNKYTSQTQYEALKEIDESKSIVKVVQNGQSSKTLGALIRSMWIKQTDYTDAEGVMREGWFVNEEGKHAMVIFAEKDRIQKEEQERNAKRIEDCLKECKHLSDVVNKYKQRKFELQTEWAQIENEIGEAKLKANAHTIFVSPNELGAILTSLGLDGEVYQDLISHVRRENPYYYNKDKIRPKTRAEAYADWKQYRKAPNVF